jgi:hypothetical protein
MKELNSAYAFYYSELWTFVGKSKVGTLSLREGKGEYTAKKKKKNCPQKKLLCQTISSYINQCLVWEFLTFGI